MYFAHVKEKLGVESYQDEDGFFTYLRGQVFFVDELYIKPESRGREVGKRYLEKLQSLCQIHGYKEIFCSVALSSLTRDRAMHAFLKHGFSLSHIKDQSIYLRKVI